MNERTVPNIQEDRCLTAIIVELGLLVDQGLLQMGINGLGEAVYWPTEVGQRILGMLPM